MTIPTSPDMADTARGLRLDRRLVALLAVVLAAIVVMATIWQASGAKPAEVHVSGAKPPPLPFAAAAMSATGRAVLEDVTPETAMSMNAARPVDAVINPAARAFKALASGESAQRSLDCLTAAIYYEAANEPADGQRAVAQVVLNRVRHPAYPPSVCGVVFQGYRLSTGCQFSFTCDGSLLRIPASSAWLRARTVAAAALAGYVYKPAGLATHYHADYVVPFWASSLSKVLVVGRHIFYRINGYSTPRLFSQAYAGSEPLLFNLQSSGALALVSEGADQPVEGQAEPAQVQMTARPILDSHGQALSLAQVAQQGAIAGPSADTGKPRVALLKSSAAANGQDAPKPAAARTERWVLGMPAPAASPAPVAAIEVKNGLARVR